MNNIRKLFRSKLVFDSNATNKEELFREVGQYLINNHYVKDTFIEEIIEREKNYPTGLDLSPVSEYLNNVAIPHTEIEHCLSKAIVFVRLNNKIEFNNMIKSEERIKVKYVFIIVNNESDNQTNVLSGIMDFITDENNMKKLDRIKKRKEIFEYLQENFQE